MRNRSPYASVAVVSLLLLAAACADGATADAPAVLEPVTLGEAPVPRVHLFENHSSALIAWRRAGVRDRIVVHLDGHADFDWLPDRTVARVAAALPDELGEYELHPYSMGPETMDSFGIWNFIYPAARLGIVRELIWVVPDGTLADAPTANRFIDEILVRKMQGIGLDEARSLRFDNGVVRGRILDLPILICELERVPRVREPVLLDIDLDYFTTRSALTQFVTARPWIMPDEVLRSLQGKQMRTDLVTLSLSTIGGYLPPSERWLGRYLQQLLGGGPAVDTSWSAELRRAGEETESGAWEAALDRLSRVVESFDDPAVWYGIADLHHRRGDDDAAAEAFDKAAAGDPLYEHHRLFRGDRAWLNGDWALALGEYRQYLGQHPAGPFSSYALRRVGNCLTRLNRIDDAIDAYRQVVEAEPEHGDTRVDLAALLRERGELDEAIRHMRAARRILPDRAMYALALGTTYLVAGRTDDGIAELNHAIGRQPCLATAHGNLSLALMQVGRNQEAAAHLRTALSLQPNNARLLAVQRQLRQQAQVNVGAPR